MNELELNDPKAIGEKIALWIEEFVTGLESGVCQTWYRGDCEWDCSGSVGFADVDDVDFHDLETALDNTYSGASEATYCSGMGLIYKTNAETLWEFILELVRADLPDDESEAYDHEKDNARMEFVTKEASLFFDWAVKEECGNSSEIQDRIDRLKKPQPER